MIPSYKRAPEQEYVIHLFDHCNLRCSFCWQGHVERPSESSILTKLDTLSDAMKRESARTLVINVMGGELFSDEIFTNSMLVQYTKLLDGIFRLSKEYNKDVSVNFLTNLVTDKLIEIDELLSYGVDIGLDVTLGVSYDSKGRFNRIQLQKFKDNLEVFSDSIHGISMVMSKLNINAIMNKSDEYFDYLYEAGIPIYMDNYMPDKDACDVPDDDLLLEFHKYVVDNYPRLAPFNSWLDTSGRPNTITCRTTKMILKDGSMSLCGGLIDADKRDVLYKDTLNANSNDKIEETFLEEKGCLSCEYFQRCTLSCFMQSNYANRKEAKDCIQYKTFEYIDSRGK